MIFFVGALLLMDFFLFLSPFRNFVASSGFMVKALQQMTHSISSGQYQTLSPGFYLLRIFNWILLSTPAFRFFQFSGWVLLACAVSALAVLWINRKTSGHLFLPLAGAAVWLGIYIANMIRVAMPNLFDNLNIYVILFPFWILMGTFLSTPGRIPAGKTLSICSRALIRVLLLALLVYSFISNLTTYFLPRHAGYSDSVGAVARFYERELRSDDLVITTRNYADFFAYFVKCRTVNIVFPSSFVSSNRGRAEYIMQLADEYMGAGRRVIWHHVAAVYGTQTQEIWNRRVDVSEDDYKKISAFLEKEIRKKWLLVPGKQYSTENGLYILERPSR